MKKFIKVPLPRFNRPANLPCMFLVLFAIQFSAGAFGAPAQEGGAIFKNAEEKEWMLLEFRSGGKTVTINRQKIEADLGKVYVIYFFEDGRAGGVGAPNRFNAPWSAGANRSLTIGNIASTMMMAFREPDELKESEYFSYLSGVSRWDLREGKLELYSTDSAGVETVLVFVTN